MIILPARGVGLLVIFCIGFVITYAVMGFFLPPLWAKHAKKPGKSIWNASTQKYMYEYEQLETVQIILSILGGLVTLVLFLWLLFSVDDSIRWIIWGGVTLLGIIAGLLTFALK